MAANRRNIAPISIIIPPKRPGYESTHEKGAQRGKPSATIASKAKWASPEAITTEATITGRTPDPKKPAHDSAMRGREWVSSRGRL